MRHCWDFVQRDSSPFWTRMFPANLVRLCSGIINDVELKIAPGGRAPLRATDSFVGFCATARFQS